MEAINPESEPLEKSVAKLKLIDEIDENRYIRNTASIRLKALERCTSADPQVVADLLYEYEMSKFLIESGQQAKAELESELDSLLQE